jgi:multidrug resistance efflux pump
MAGAALIACLWFFFAEIPYRISVPCSITAATMRSFAAPFQGAIGEAYVEVGDHVEKGQLLCKMDTTLLRLRRGELESESAIALLQSSQAVKDQDFDAAAHATSRLRVIQARLDVIQQQIHQSQIRAPCRGIIMSGEISRRVGEIVPMGEPLIQFAPHEAWCIHLHISEKDILSVQSGLNGKFSSLARPGDSVPFTIELIGPASELLDQQNVFVANASVSRNPSWMRVGMQGIATVDAGSRRVCWVALHRVFDWIRLHSGF